ncbi:hypothetical protein A5886_001595 [Enterococcus sp. 8G7_MSG3316]|uniref:YxeA family protein n=1 Tax=Candidatus Enterococcus testudinis TaxID=1834191 RepID=A0A242A655_9ENTE|nr:hypothetical protein [Enterococcus sp. 8G7_MSG3316]OTN76518.1 hypothetical protein A5886_001595 [Enterococcus sp. 8G7_MSG3316]
MFSRRLKFHLIFGMILILIIGISYLTYSIDTLNRFYPFLPVQTGYAILPQDVTYNNGQIYKVDTHERQFPDPYVNMRVVNKDSEDVRVLTFSGGQSPEGKNFAEVQYKLNYVYEIHFIYWEQIPEHIQKKLENINIEQ